MLLILKVGENMQFVKFEHQPTDEDYKILKELGYDDARIKFIDSFYSFDFLEILQDDCGSSGGGGHIIYLL